MSTNFRGPSSLIPEARKGTGKEEGKGKGKARGENGEEGKEEGTEGREGKGRNVVPHISDQSYAPAHESET